jgi:hypothetical protein
VPLKRVVREPRGTSARRGIDHGHRLETGRNAVALSIRQHSVQRRSATDTAAAVNYLLLRMVTAAAGDVTGGAVTSN